MKKLISKSKSIDYLREIVKDVEDGEFKYNSEEPAEEFVYATTVSNLKYESCDSIFGDSDNIILIRVWLGRDMFFNENLERYTFPYRPKFSIEFFHPKLKK